MNSFNSKPDESTTVENEIIAALLKYPSLEKVFEKSAADGYEKTKQKMNTVITELERVIRRGTKDESEKAETIIDGYRTALRFLG